MNKNEQQLFFNEKPVKMLIQIRMKEMQGEVYTSELSKNVDTTYAHACGIMKEMVNEGLVERERKGRKKLVSLTDRGQQWADRFIEILHASNLGEAA